MPRRSQSCLLAVAALGAASFVAPILAAGPLPTQKGAAAAGCVEGSIHALRTDRLSYAAIATRPLDVRRVVGNRKLTTRFQKRNVNGVETTFGVLAERVGRTCHATEYNVQLPIRPNGSTGWVRAADVRLRIVRTRIEVDLSQRRIVVFDDGQVVLETTAAIGAPSTPTPTGRFYVNQRLLAANPIGGYGPGAVGISAFSPTLLTWPQGGPIAIHGTDAPSLVGSAVSHGCLRIYNSDALRLLRLAPEGTPVSIRR